MSNRTRALPAAETLLSLALEAHMSITLNWPHASLQASKAIGAAADQLMAELNQWCARQSQDVEDEQRHTKDATALAELCRRAKERKPEGIEEVIARKLGEA